MLEQVTRMSIDELLEVRAGLDAQLEKRRAEKADEDQIARLASKLGRSDILEVLGRAALSTDQKPTERHAKLQEFQRYLIEQLDAAGLLDRKRKPTIDHWILLPLGATGFNRSLTFTGNYARAEVGINRGARTKEAFDWLLERKESIEREFGAPLVWDRMDGKVTSRVKAREIRANVYDKSQWEMIASHLVDEAPRLLQAFAGPVKELVKEFG